MTTGEQGGDVVKVNKESSALVLYAVELRTAQWETMLHWYRQTLGMSVPVRVVEDGYALLMAGGGRLAIMRRPQIGPVAARFSLAFEVADLTAAFIRLQNAGSPVEGPREDAEGYWEITTQDPDGNRIRLFTWPTR